MSAGTAGLLFVVAALAGPRSVAAWSAEGISCRLVLSIDASVNDRWEHTAGQEGVKLVQTSEVVRQQAFAAYVFFGNVATDSSGNLRVQYDVHVAAPDGKTYFEQKEIEGVTGRPASVAGVLLARDLIHVSFDPPDPLGDYTVRITVRDVNGKTSASQEQKITLVECAEPPGFQGKDDLLAWVGGYAAKPEPARAIAAFVALGKLGGWEHDDLLPIARGFFREVFAGNEWLYPRLLAKYGEQDAATRRAILGLLAGSTYDGKAFVATLEPSDRQIWQQISAARSHDPLLEPIHGREDLNALWGMYAASNRFDPVRRLCEAMVPEETGAVANLARESIVAHAAHDTLLTSYCRWLAAAPETRAVVRREIRSVLGPQ